MILCTMSGTNPPGAIMHYVRDEILPVYYALCQGRILQVLLCTMSGTNPPGAIMHYVRDESSRCYYALCQGRILQVILCTMSGTNPPGAIMHYIPVLLCTRRIPAIMHYVRDESSRCYYALCQGRILQVLLCTMSGTNPPGAIMHYVRDESSR